MRLRRGVAAAALLGVSALASPAEAQYLSWRASLTASGSYSYSITDDQYPNAQTFAGPSLSLSPSLVLLYDTPLTNNTLTYTFGLSLPFTRDLQLATGPLAYSNRFSYSGHYTLSELSSLSLSLSLNHSPMRGLSLGGEANETPIEAGQVSSAYMLSMSAQESFTRTLSEALTFTQSTGVSLTNPIDPLISQPRTLSITNGLSLSRLFNVDSLGISLSVATSYFMRGETVAGGVTEPRLSISDTLSFTWSRPLTATLTGSAALGATQVISPDQTTPTAVQPSGNLSLTYNLGLAVLTLSYAHAAAPNLLTGSVNFTDSGTLRFNLPLGTTGLSTTGSAGFSHMTPIGAVGSPTDIFLSDLSLSYHPQRVPSLTLSLRSQLTRQAAGEAADGFTRIATSLSVSYSYPSASAAQATPNMPPSLGATPYVPGGGDPLPLRPFEEPSEQRPLEKAPPPR